jgi:hypothetical protein
MTTALERAVLDQLKEWTWDGDLYAAFPHLHWSQVHRVVLRLANRGEVQMRLAGTQLRASREAAAASREAAA